MKSGEFLRKKRLEKNLSLRQLAYKSGLSHSYIADIEKGNLIGTTETREKIMSALNLNKEEQEEFYFLTLENSELPDFVLEQFKQLQTELKTLRSENISLKQKITVQNNNNIGTISIGNTNMSSSNSAVNTDGLTAAQVEEVKKYIEFLKVQNKINNN
jgi:transcriptional regulator with XRE-family HTH domain